MYTLPVGFRPTAPGIPPVLASSTGWFQVNAVESYLFQPLERKIISCGYVVERGSQDICFVELDFDLALKGLILLGHNLHPNLWSDKELLIIVQNLNQPDHAADPMQIFGHKHKVQISVGQPLIKLKRIVC